MRRNPRLFRLTSSVAVGALLWDAAWPLAAMAQPAPPPLPPAQGQPDQNQADPPARVGRVAAITGTVSFHNAGDTQWSTASVNYPVSSGNAFWTEPSAETQLEISDSRIALAGGSEFDVYALDASGLQGVAALGETYFRLRDLAPNEMWSVQTPRGLVHLGGAGRYGIVVGTTEQPTLVTVLEGSAQIEGPGVSLQVGAGQTATISGTDSFQGSVGPAVRDAFLTERLNAERPPPALASVPAQVAVMPGGADLYGVGSWSPAPEYGQVWYPPVSPGWVPYREGHWAYVAPWGWTWIDNAPWGFAPFHYGRWLQIDGRWGWTPGEAAVAGPPVYAPALVAFIGIGAGVALGAALASRSIGWVPLGPREPFRPWYHASDNYVRQVNVNHVTNITNITTNNNTTNNFVNRGAATSIPAAAMMASRPVQAVARPVTAQEFAAARPIIVGQQPLRPTAATAGVTPAVARQLYLPPGPVVRPAPGPVVRTQAPGAAGTAFARPALAPPAGSGPGNTAIRPAAGGPATPEQNRLPLTAPGGRPATSPAPNTPEPNRPAVVAPGAHPGGSPPTEPRVVHPGERAPERAAPPVATPRPPPPTPQAARPVPQAAPPPPHPEPRVVAPPVAQPRPEVRPAAPPPPRPEPPRPAAPPPPRPEPPRAVAPPPRPAPAALPAPAPRPEPPAREKRPDQH